MLGVCHTLPLKLVSQRGNIVKNLFGVVIRNHVRIVQHYLSVRVQHPSDAQMTWPGRAQNAQFRTQSGILVGDEFEGQGEFFAELRMGIGIVNAYPQNANLAFVINGL